MLADLLTPAERKLLRMSLMHTDKDVAAQLGCAVQTVKNKRQSIYSKLGVAGVHPVVRSAEILGWLKVPDA